MPNPVKNSKYDGIFLLKLTEIPYNQLTKVMKIL